MTGRHAKKQRYVSQVRADGMELTRERILAAVMDHLAADAGPITLRAIARRAGVSTPTVIRHFADREALIEAFWDWVQPRLGMPDRPQNAADMPKWPERLFTMMDGNAGFFRALVVTPEGRAMRARRWGQRAQISIDSLEPLVRGLSPAAKKRVVALTRMLVSGMPIWLELRELWGLDGREMGRVCAWVLKLIVAELKRNPTSPEEEP